MFRSAQHNKIIKTHSVGSRKVAFTLAEVLITLGIIGVVAAMTLPNLIANTKKSQFTSQLKKTLSTVNQVVLLSKAKYDLTFADISLKCNDNTDLATGETPENNATVCALFNSTLSGATYWGLHHNIPIYKGSKKIYSIDASGATDWLTGTTASSFYSYQLSDGSVVSFNHQIANCMLTNGAELTNDLIRNGTLKPCIGWIDVNGTALPNKEVRCASGHNDIDYNDCVVKEITDIYPIVFHDSVVEPASAAARVVLSGK